jgi:hypothetical protein
MNTHAKRLSANLRKLTLVRNNMKPGHRIAVGNAMESVLAIIQAQQKQIKELRENCPPPAARTPTRAARFGGRPPRPPVRSPVRRKV